MNKQATQPRRDGAAFFMLVLAILIVIMSATSLLIRGEWLARRSQRDQSQTQTLISAIEVASDASADSMTLPIDPESNERIEIELDQETDRYTARWLRKDETLDTLTRNAKNQNEEEPNDE